MEHLKAADEAGLAIPPDVTDAVRDIVDTLREGGDAGVRSLTRRFDDVEREALRVTDEEIESAAAELSEAERRTIDSTIANVRAFDAEQFDHLEGFERAFEDGVTLGTRLVPVERAGVYVPGGRKPLVAAPAMTIVPAAIAGVEEAVACAPPQADGSVQAAQLYAMDRAGADEIYVAGGA